MNDEPQPSSAEILHQVRTRESRWRIAMVILMITLVAGFGSLGYIEYRRYQAQQDATNAAVGRTNRYLRSAWLASSPRPTGRSWS